MMKKCLLILLCLLVVVLPTGCQQTQEPAEEAGLSTVNLLYEHLDKAQSVKMASNGVVSEDTAFDKALETVTDGNTMMFKDVKPTDDGYAGVLFTLDDSYTCEEIVVYSGFAGKNATYRVYAGEDLDSLYSKKHLVTKDLTAGGEPGKVGFNGKAKYIAFFCTAFDKTQQIKEFEVYGKAQVKEAVSVSTGSLYVEGTHILSDGKVLDLQGVNITELSWSNYGDGSTKAGESDADHSLNLALSDWKCRIIRLAVNPGYYVSGGTHKSEYRSAQQYRDLVDSFITKITSAGVVVILDCHGFYGVTDTTMEFWRVAAPKYDQNEMVMYGLFNEPVSDWKTFYEGGTATTVEGETMQVRGMTELLDLVRSYSDNIAVIGGIDWAFDLSCVTESDMRVLAEARADIVGMTQEEYFNKYFLGSAERRGNGIVYETHPYSNKPEDWDTYLGNAMKEYPVLFGEFGPAENKGVITKLTDADELYLKKAFDYITEHELSSTAWGMSAWPFLTQTNGHVTPFGEAVRKYIQTGKY